MSKVIFVDFDGTITKEDTCDAMVRVFASEGWEEIGRLWEEKKLTTAECANRLFELLNADLEDIGRLMDAMEIDEHFKAFLAMCEDKCYKVFILSDGYDFNIERILRRYDIQVPFYANKLLYDVGFRIQCPYQNADCGRCGTCKTNLISSLTETGDEVIYIGDGFSDNCAATHADLVFAKGSLYRFCQNNHVPAIKFEDFGDILESHLL